MNKEVVSEFSKEEVDSFMVVGEFAKKYLDGFERSEKEHEEYSGDIKKGALRGQEYQVYAMSGENFPAYRDKTFAKILVGDQTYYYYNYARSKEGYFYQVKNDEKVLCGRYSKKEPSVMDWFRGKGAELILTPEPYVDLVKMQKGCNEIGEFMFADFPKEGAELGE